ncbi:hypothetical protein OAQ99_01475 [Candidatus Kapabacteria bacterium]|nr:hypothetical protein [Candidatus Kapabacteria bacterium]
MSQENDSLWNFEDLEPLDSEVPQFETGKGWFPGTPSGISMISGNILFGLVFTGYKNIESESFVDVGGGFSRLTADIGDKFRISKKWSEESKRPGITSSLFGIGSSIIKTYDLPFFIEFSTNLEYRSDYLLSNLGNKPYLTHENDIDYFEEFGVILFEEYLVGSYLGVKIPIYGGFVNTRQNENLISNQVSSLYTLNLGFGADYTIYGDLHQYNIIGTKKNHIRYESGYDTLSYLNDAPIKSLNNLRAYVLLGSSFFTSSFGFGFETSFNFKIPLNQMLDDAKWRQFIFASEIKIYFDL